MGAVIVLTVLVLATLVLATLILVVRAVRVIPEGYAGVVERTGRYRRTVTAGWALVDPVRDRLRALVDLRERVVPIAVGPVPTADDATVRIEAAVRFTVVDPVAATYHVRDVRDALGQLTATALRAVAGGLTLEDAVTGRGSAGEQLRTVLDEATGVWGIRVDGAESQRVDVIEYRGATALAAEE